MDDLAVMDDLDLVRAIPGAAVDTRVTDGNVGRARLRLTCLRGEKIVLGDGDRPAILMTEGYFLLLSRAQTDALRRCAASGETVLIEMADGSRHELSAYPRRPT
jgi:hypothetical protein